MKRVLVISPHPDDESIGCGGSLRQHAVAGDVVHVVFLTSGEKGGHGRPEIETVRLREEEARAAAAVLGVRELEFWREPDGALEARPELIGRVKSKFRSFAPDVLYVPHPEESHPDHRVAAQLALGSVRNADAAAEVWGYEVWTPIQRIDRVEDISAHIETKMAAIRTYRCQCEVLAFDEAFRGLARYRGEMHSWPGGDYAEVFTRLAHSDSEGE
jgi:LmbE family N-acetylglucosaminyl deacetylase